MDKTLKIVYSGPCKTTTRWPCAIRCSNDPYAPVCGSDGVTYVNHYCLTLNQACNNEFLTEVHTGPCGPTIVPTIGPSPPILSAEPALDA